MRQRGQTFIDIRARHTATVALSFIFAFFGFAFIAILLKLFDMQFNHSEQYRRMAEANSVRNIPVPPVRASIFDRRGKPLAVDVPAYKMISVRKNGAWEEKHIDFKEAVKIIESEKHGKYVETYSVRRYPTGALTSHIVGYTGVVAEQDLARLKNSGYKNGDLAGKSGLERKYELALNGKRGKIILSVDSRGFFMDEKGSEPAVGAPPLKTSIDIRLQETAYKALEERGEPGAIIVAETGTGNIVAMATYPSYDNNLAVGGFKASDWTKYQTDPLHPLLNRATSISVPLGSVFKPIMVAAAVNEGIADANRKFYCPGSFRLGRRVFKCWQSGGHGSITLVNGLAQSCDVVFYTLGLELGVTKIRKYARMFGLGSKTGIDIPGEAIGTVPDPEWKKRFKGDNWYKGDTVNMSIGQGFSQVSPIQALMMADAMATSGILSTPRIAANGKAQRKKLGLSPKAFETARTGMKMAVLSGTSQGMKSLPVTSGGKTGTADDPPRETPHAWYAGFAPFDKPKLTFVVFVENGGHGASDALPLARKVIERAIETGWFPDVKKEPAKKLVVKER